MSKIVLAGGSGFLGQTLSHHLEESGKEVVILGRSGQSAARGISGRFVEWDAKSLGSWQEELEEAEALFNLCGRSVDCRYDERNKRLILNSRVDSTRILGEAVQACSRPPKVWLNASTATLYQDRRGDLPPHNPSFCQGVDQSLGDAPVEGQETPKFCQRVVANDEILGCEGENWVLACLCRP